MRFRKLHVLLGVLTFVCGVATYYGAHLAEAQIDNLFSRTQSTIPRQSFVDEAAEEQAVYQTIFDELYAKTAKILTIEAQTTRCTSFEDRIDDATATLKDPFAGFRETMSVGIETTSDYVAKNKTPTTLALGELDVPHLMLSEKEVMEFFGEDKYGWKEFYKRYPTSSGLIFLSRIGFNNSHNEAFVYVGRTCGGECGAGGYFSFKKLGERWIITKYQGVWIS